VTKVIVPDDLYAPIFDDTASVGALRLAETHGEGCR
jgi:hypothetical protein